MSNEREHRPRLPPRRVVRLIWYAHRGLYRVTGGRVGLWRPKNNRWGTLRLTTTGRHTGKARSVILGYFEDGPNMVTLAMNGWADGEPSWWLNLQEHPETSVELADGPCTVRARAAEGEERSRLWTRWREIDTKLDAYAALRSSATAVVILEALPSEQGGNRACRSTMRAVVQDSYGPADLLQVRDVATPVVGDDEVLVRVRAASVHPDVWHVVSGRPYVLRLMGSGVRRPRNRVPGTDVAGHVEVVGRQVTRFRPGDEVFGETVTGYQWHNGGAYAEYVSVPQDALALKPGNITFEQAAAVPTSGLIALHNLRQGRLQPGQRVLVNGAGGGVGALAVQLATARGATVTGVDAAVKLDMIRSLGAAHVVDFTQEDFTRFHQSYELIFDVVGNRPFRECRRALTPDGAYVLIGHDGFGDAAGRWLGSLPRVLGLVAMSPFMSQLPAIDFSLPDKKDSMAVLNGHLEAGELTPLVDKTFSLNEVPAALRYLETGQAIGKIVISI